MSDPESLTLTVMREALLVAGIGIDNDFVSLEICDDKVMIERLERSPAGMACPRDNGGVRTITTIIPVVPEPGEGPEPDPQSEA